MNQTFNEHHKNRYDVIPFRLGNANVGMDKFSFHNSHPVVAVNTVVSQDGEVTILFTVKTA